MSEEIRNPNTELNEAALENAGGGYSAVELFMAESYARDMCNLCDYRNAVNRNQHVKMLAEYFLANGTRGFDQHKCPFFPK